MKLCKDCKHFETGSIAFPPPWQLCRANVEPVFGRGMDALLMRCDPDRCGPDASKFEPKEPVIYPPKRWWQKLLRAD